MTNKTCTTCIDNDNGLCDRKGILIHEDDTFAVTERGLAGKDAGEV